MLESLQKIYNEIAGRQVMVLTPQTKISDMKLSSLGLINLICQIEDTYDIEIPNQDIVRFKTVNDVIRSVEKLLK